MCPDKIDTPNSFLYTYHSQVDYVLGTSICLLFFCPITRFQLNSLVMSLMTMFMLMISVSIFDLYVSLCRQARHKFRSYCTLFFWCLPIMVKVFIVSLYNIVCCLAYHWFSKFSSCHIVDITHWFYNNVLWITILCKFYFFMIEPLKFSPDFKGPIRGKNRYASNVNTMITFY